MNLLTEPIWRRFWYPVAFTQDLGELPLARTVLGTRLAIWSGPDGEPCGAIDRCPHRDAAISQGWTCEGRIVCPYHGWEYNNDGRVAIVPQTPDVKSFPKRFSLDMVHCQARYGVVWICLDEPVRPIPVLPDSSLPNWRMIREFDEVWNTGAARLMENSFDPAHTVFVHKATFGNTQKPDVDVPTIDKTSYGLIVRNDLSVANPSFAKAVTGEANSEYTVRRTVTEFHAPFLRVLQSTYPGGRIHQIITAATPIDDENLRLVQWAIRNDTEADAKAVDIVAFDRRVTWEDQALLEGIWAPYSEVLDSNIHIKVDRPTVEIRRIYGEIIAGTWVGLQDESTNAISSNSQGVIDPDGDTGTTSFKRPQDSDSPLSSELFEWTK